MKKLREPGPPGTVRLVTEGMRKQEARDEAAFDKAKFPRIMSASTAVKIHYIKTGDMLTQKQLKAFNQAKKPKITRRPHKRPVYQNNKSKRILQEIANYQGTIYTELDGMSKYDYRFWGPAEFLEELTDTATYEEFKKQGIDFIITLNRSGYWMRRKLEQFEGALVDPRAFIKKEKLS